MSITGYYFQDRDFRYDYERYVGHKIVCITRGHGSFGTEWVVQFSDGSCRDETYDLVKKVCGRDVGHMSRILFDDSSNPMYTRDYSNTASNAYQRWTRPNLIMDEYGQGNLGVDIGYTGLASSTALTPVKKNKFKESVKRLFWERFYTKGELRI